MSKYWKLLVLRTNQYIECETEEEVIHLIESLCKDMEQEQTYKHHTIETQYPNYNFEHVTVFDSSNVRQFIYFFDTIEEELESHEESNQLDELREQISRRNSKIVELKEDCDRFRELARERNDELSELQKRYDDIDEAFDRVVDENSDLREQICRRNNKNAELEGKLIRYAGEIEDLKYENSNLRKELKSALESLHDQYDDKSCCKKCVHCRPFVGSTDCYCSQTCELIKNEHAETYYCKDMIPYEDDYPF